mmetsp:Transcript_2100/g.3799  ORF Transcript_2100/g.3799 Transcript_2100/m.3799 type:complete len:283 (-) Transcript_2100:620-1468(-)
MRNPQLPSTQITIIPTRSMKLSSMQLIAFFSYTAAFVPPRPAQYLSFTQIVASARTQLCISPSSSTSHTAETAPIQQEHGHVHGGAVTIDPNDNSILTELRTVAMKLHTKEQAPREGEAPSPAKPAEPYAPTQSDYLQFLVDSLHIYEALEEVVESHPVLKEKFSNSGLERTEALNNDIVHMMEKFGLERPAVGRAGRRYAEELRNMVSQDGDGIPEFICHYYNFYFAHLAGGRMIGKQMSNLLLGGETLEFYKVKMIFFLEFFSRDDFIIYNIVVIFLAVG